MGLARGRFDHAERLFRQVTHKGNRLLVLDLALVEVANAIWKRHHRRLISLGDARRFVADLSASPLQVQSANRLFNLPAKLPSSTTLRSMTPHLLRLPRTCGYLPLPPTSRYGNLSVPIFPTSCYCGTGGKHCHGDHHQLALLPQHTPTADRPEDVRHHAHDTDRLTRQSHKPRAVTDRWIFWPTKRDDIPSPGTEELGNNDTIPWVFIAGDRPLRMTGVAAAHH